MTEILVCPLAHVEATMAESGALSVVSLLSLEHRVPKLAVIAPTRHLHLPVADIVVAMDDHVLATDEHVAELLAFVQAWDRQAPLLIHCYAGVSRSTAAAFIALCAVAPDTPEAAHAEALRRASPTATPNVHLVALADAALGRSGRMIEAIAAIGRGADCFEGVRFALDVPRRSDADARGAEMV